jgi:signal transduction histidine kinase
MKKTQKKDASPGSSLAARERLLEARTNWMRVHDAASARRDAAISQREALVRQREAELEARREAEVWRVERERRLVQIREVNEKLVLASLSALQAADDANAARAAADDVAERFRSLILSSSSLVWRAGAAGRLELDHDAWREFTGTQATDDEWGWLEAVHPVDRDRVRDTWSRAVAAATPYACQHRIRNWQGGYAWVMARAVPILRSGTVREWIGMFSDVSDRVRVDEAREQFIGILGHDLRTPLASIVAGIEILRELPQPVGTIVARMGRSANRIEAIIRDLLDFARGRLGGGIPIAPKPCDMRSICEQVVEEIRQAHPTREIRFEATGDLRGEWDADRVEQVLSNLLGNAIVHGADPIVVTTRPTEDRVITSVHNKGSPIPEAVIPTLFEPFTRVDQDVADGRHDGLGLGLYIAKEIVHAHDGTLSVTSVADAGTRFTFALPRTVAARAGMATGDRS